MIKNHGDKKLSKTGSHRRAMFSNMLSSLIMTEKVITTEPKAKELKRFFDNIISGVKKENYIKVRSILRNKDAFKKLTKVIVLRYKEKNSGFTNVYKLEKRKGDGAKMALIKLVD